MRKLRFALAMLSLALAASPGVALADSQGCPYLVQTNNNTMGTCAWTGVGNDCASCTYSCNDRQYTWDMCAT